MQSPKRNPITEGDGGIIQTPQKPGKKYSPRNLNSDFTVKYNEKINPKLNFF